MSKISYFSLGGQDERWKYSGVLNVNEEFFILNMGIGCHINNQFGIQKVIPDVSYLRAHQHKVKAIFVGTPRQLNIGAVPYYLEVLPNVPIYTSALGKQIILDYLDQHAKKTNKTFEPNIIAVNPINEIAVGSIKVLAVKIANSIPNSYSWIFKTASDESVVFVDEFLVANENLPCCESQIHQIAQQAKNKTSLLIIGNQCSGKYPGFSYTAAQNYSFLKKACASTKKRVVVACYRDDWYTLLNLSKIAKIYSMSLHITCSAVAKLFNTYVENLKKPIYAQSNKLFNTDDSLIIVVGDHDTLYEKLLNIAEDKDDFKFNQNDLFILSTITFPEREVDEINVINAVSKQDIIIVKQPKTICSFTAGNEDVKTLVNAIYPFNVVTVNCYYKDYINFVKACENTINTSRINFLEIGQSLVIDGKHTAIEPVPISEQYVGEDSILSINKSIVTERQLITQNGVVLASVAYNQPKHSIFVGSFELIGVFADDYGQINKVNSAINKYLANDISKFLALNKILDIKSIKNCIKRSIYSSLENFTQKKPVVLSLITNLN